MALPVALQNLSLPVIASPMFIASGPALVIGAVQGRHRRFVPGAECAPGGALDVWLTRDRRRSWPRSRRPIRAQGRPDRGQPDRAPVQRPPRARRRSVRPAPGADHHLQPARAAEEMLDAIHCYGGIVLHDVISCATREKALEAGVDGLILVAPAPAAMPARCRRSRWSAKCATSSTARSCCRARSPPATRSWPRRRWARTSPTSARACWPRRESNVRRAPTARRSSKSRAADIVYTNLFTGVHGNYLKHSRSSPPASIRTTCRSRTNRR